MSIADNLIANEQVVFESKKHWVAPVRDSVIPACLLLVAALLGVIRPSGGTILGFVGSVMGWLQVGLVIAGVLWIVYNVFVWRSAQFAVTNLRVLRYEGILQRRTSETLLASVTDVRLAVGVLGRQLGFGDITVLTASSRAGEDRFTSITSPTEFRNTLMEQKMAREQAVVQAAPVHAPLPEAAVAAAAPSAPVPAASQAPAAPSAADAADAIRRLAELRDQGVISVEEFEAKKAELLARI